MLALLSHVVCANAGWDKEYPMSFNEAKLEQAIIELLAQQGYPHYTGG